MPKHLVVLAAIILFAIAGAASLGSYAVSSPAAVAGALSTDKAEAQALVSDLRDAIDSLNARATDVADVLSKLKVDSDSRTARERARAEAKSIAADLASLDANLRALDLRIAALSPGAKRATGTALSSKVDVAATSGTGFRVVCDLSDRTVGAGDPVTFKALVSGGTLPYAYSWSGAFEGNAQSQKASFVRASTYWEKVTVTDKKGKKVSDDCPKLEVSNTYSDDEEDDIGARAVNSTLSILQPVAGARLTVGTSTTIGWKSAGLASGDSLDITLSGGEDGVTYFVASSLPKGNEGRGSFTWRSVGTVASDFIPNGTYTLRVCTVDEEVCGAAKVSLVR
jgi:hypothetical protein